jgi:hypothetical protein
MHEIWQRFVGNLFARLDGPFHFRIILQPVMATIFAIIRGVQDAKQGKPAYLWGVILDREHRKELLRDGWKQAGRIFIIAIVLDVAYQIYVLHAFYPGETLVVAFLLAIVPYVVVRGPVNRIVRLFQKKTPEIHPASRDTSTH